jgi:hypothetical protein
VAEARSEATRGRGGERRHGGAGGAGDEALDGRDRLIDWYHHTKLYNRYHSLKPQSTTSSAYLIPLRNSLSSKLATSSTSPTTQSHFNVHAASSPSTSPPRSSSSGSLTWAHQETACQKPRGSIKTHCHASTRWLSILTPSESGRRPVAAPAPPAAGHCASGQQ